MKWFFTLTVATLLSVVGLEAFAGFQGYNGTTDLRIFNKIQCSTGLTCTKVGDKFKIVSSPTITVGGLAITGAEAGDASITLSADESDDAGDDWKIESDATTNNLILSNDTSGSLVTMFSFTPQASLSFSNAETLSQPADDTLQATSNDEAMNFRIMGFEAKGASLELAADESDDSGDSYFLNVTTADVLEVKNEAVTLNTVSSVGAWTFVGSITGDGGDAVSGFLQKQVAITTTTITAAQCGSTFVGDSADVIVLPEASTVLGCRLTFIAGTADDVDIDPADGTDEFGPVSVEGAAIDGDAGDEYRMTDIGTSMTIEAVGANLWAIIAHNGPITDVN